MAVRTGLNITGNFSGGVVYVGVANDTTSSVLLPSELTKALSSFGRLDFVVGVYPTIGSFLTPPPSLPNMTVVSTVVSVQLWSEADAVTELPAPIIITLAHTRKVIGTIISCNYYTIILRAIISILHCHNQYTLLL